MSDVAACLLPEEDAWDPDLEERLPLPLQPVSEGRKGCSSPRRLRRTVAGGDTPVVERKLCLRGRQAAPLILVALAALALAACIPKGGDSGGRGISRLPGVVPPPGAVSPAKLRQGPHPDGGPVGSGRGGGGTGRGVQGRGKAVGSALIGAEFVGLWASDELPGLTAVAREPEPADEADFVIINEGRSWNPARGSVSRGILTLHSPPEVAGLQVAVAEGQLVSDHAVLRRHEEASTAAGGGGQSADLEALARLYERAGQTNSSSHDLAQSRSQATLDTTTTTKTYTTTTITVSNFGANDHVLDFVKGEIGASSDSCEDEEKSTVQTTSVHVCRAFAERLADEQGKTSIDSEDSDQKACGYREGCEGTPEEQASWCYDAPTGCWQNITSGCFSFKESSFGYPTNSTRPICMTVGSVKISGAEGPNAIWINGHYDATGKMHNGRPLFRKRKDNLRWLRYATKNDVNSWRVSDTANVEANDDMGYSAGDGSDTFDPTTVRRWYVWNNTWQFAEDMECRKTLSSKVIEAAKVAQRKAIVAEFTKAQNDSSTGDFDNAFQYEETMHTLRTKAEAPWHHVLPDIPMWKKAKHSMLTGRWLKKSPSRIMPGREASKGPLDVEAMVKNHIHIGGGSELMTLLVARFLINSFLNGRYVERRDSVVNKRETYWSEMNFLVYYCDNYDTWMIGHSENWNDLTSGHCFFWAQMAHPHDVLDTNSFENSSGWFEWDPEKNGLTYSPNAGIEIVEPADWSPSRTDYFSSWRHHDECGRLFRDRGVRNQGHSCNNCWAMATAQVIEWRLCMAMNGTWNSNLGAISVGYITSCAGTAYIGPDGCQGGDMLLALRWVGVHGVPTGGDGNNEDTCVPNFQNGVVKADSPPPLSAAGTMKPPKCPTNCTNPSYKRHLSQDLFHLRTLSESWRTTSFESATKALGETGPIMVNFEVYEDFLGYHGQNTIYKHHPLAKKLYKHVAVAIGYSYHPRFIMCVNSWGDHWGVDGRFKINPDEVLSYVIPGNIAGSYPSGFPLPLPDGHANFELWTAGFTNVHLNGRWAPITKKQPDRWVNGKRTLWDSLASMFMYWCEWKQKWMITVSENFRPVQEGGTCFWHAVEGEDCTNLLDFVCSWEEYDEQLGDLVPRHGAGISGFTAT